MILKIDFQDREVKETWKDCEFFGESSEKSPNNNGCYWLKSAPGFEPVPYMVDRTSHN